MRPFSPRPSGHAPGWLGEVLQRITAPHGGELVPDVQVGDVHVDWVAVLPTGVFVVGPAGPRLSRQRAALASTLGVRVEAVSAEDPASLRRILLGSTRSPRPRLLDDSAVGRMAARIRLGGVVRIIGA